MKPGGFLKKLVFGYDKLEEYVLCASLVLTTLIVFAQIIMRPIKALSWSEELTRYIFIWQIWMGVSIAERDDQHIRVELLYSFVKNPKAKAVIDVIATLILVSFSAFLVYVGIELVQQMMTRGNVSGAMRLPMYIVYMVLPLSSFILCLRLLARLYRDCRKAFGKEETES